MLGVERDGGDKEKNMYTLREKDRERERVKIRSV